MSLVPDYNSDSDSDSDSDTSPDLKEPTVVEELPKHVVSKAKSKKKIITLDLPTEDVPEIHVPSTDNNDDIVEAPKNGDRVSIASFLPPPKNRKKQTPKSLQQQEQSKPATAQRVLGSTNSVPRINMSRNIPQNAQPNSVTPLPEKKSEEPVIPSLFSFDTHKPVISSTEAVRPVRSSSQFAAKQFGPSRPGNFVPEIVEDPVQAIPEVPVETNIINTSGKRTRKRGRDEIPDASGLVEFNVDEFYAENMAHGNMSEDIKRPVKAVGSSRQQHQLSSLIRSAQQNQAGLQEMYAQQKRTKKEVGSKYGF